MTQVQKIPVTVFLAILIITVGCNNSLVVKNVDYSHPIETVLQPDEQGNVHDIRHGLSYSILPFQYEEFQDSSSVSVSEVRMIRNAEGYYFITANNFRHVYVMKPGKGELELKRKILITENGLEAPAFNWRAPIVQLLDQSTKQVYLLNDKGIYKEESS